jgi:hypothetical protein
VEIIPPKKKIGCVKLYYEDIVRLVEIMGGDFKIGYKLEDGTGCIFNGLEELVEQSWGVKVNNFMIKTIKKNSYSSNTLRLETTGGYNEYLLDNEFESVIENYLRQHEDDTLIESEIFIRFEKKNFRKPKFNLIYKKSINRTENNVQVPIKINNSKTTQSTSASKKETEQTKTKWIVASILVPIICAFIQSSWFIPLILSNTWAQKPLLTTTLTSDNNLSQTQETDLLRALEPLETGKLLQELPNNTYFYANIPSIQAEISHILENYIRATNKDEDYYFELQKVNDTYYLIGFVSKETYSNVLSPKSTSYSFILYPKYDEDYSKVIAIPFDSITQINDRTLNIDKNLDIYIFDISITKAIDGISHKLI